VIYRLALIYLSWIWWLSPFHLPFSPPPFHLPFHLLPAPFHLLAELFALKRELRPQLERVPYVEDGTPVVCAWYPTARAVLLWNLTEQPQNFTLRYGNSRRSVRVDGLDVALLEQIVVRRG
jgi:hypothetical protein